MAITKLVSDSLGAGVGGSMVKLATQTASNVASVIFDDYFTSDYDNYVIFVNGYYGSSATIHKIILRSSGSDITTSYYSHVGRGHRDSGTSYWENVTATWNGGDFRYNGDTVGTAATHSYDGRFYLFNALSTTSNKRMIGDITYLRSAGNAIERDFSHLFLGNSASALSGIKFAAATGNIYGTFTLYGVTV